MKRLHDGRQTLTDKQEAYVIGLRELHSSFYVHCQKQKNCCKILKFLWVYPITKTHPQKLRPCVLKEKRKKLSELHAVKFLPVLAPVIG
jgi:hypothetical protein